MVPGNLGEWKTDLNAALKLLVNNADKFDVIKVVCYFTVLCKIIKINKDKNKEIPFPKTI